jgi:hypothetical protein
LILFSCVVLYVYLYVYPYLLGPFLICEICVIAAGHTLVSAALFFRFPRINSRTHAGVVYGSDTFDLAQNGHILGADPPES